MDNRGCCFVCVCIRVKKKIYIYYLYIGVFIYIYIYSMYCCVFVLRVCERVFGNTLNDVCAVWTSRVKPLSGVCCVMSVSC